MLFLSFALQSEAIPIIKYYNLKKSNKHNSFKIYENENIKLVVSGVGQIQSAIAVSTLLSLYNAKKEDVVLNIGVCGFIKKNDYDNSNIGKLYRVNSIYPENKTNPIYPDIVVSTQIQEAMLLSLDRIWINNDKKLTLDANRNVPTITDMEENLPLLTDMEENLPLLTDMEENLPLLTDMEGYGFYKAAINFLYSHNILLLKIVSDFGENKKLSAEYISNLIEKNLDKLNEIISKVEKISKLNDNKIKNYERIREFVEKVAQQLSLTKYQNTEFLSLLHQYSIRQKDPLLKVSDKSFDDIIKDIELIVENNSQIKEKKQGKRVYEDIKRKLI